MAKVDLFQSTKTGAFLFYNLDASVGKGGANRRDDVLLVQYLLKTSSMSHGWRCGPGRRHLGRGR